MSDREGQQLGSYRLIESIGRGGFADVYLGEHVHLGTKAAIKVLRDSLVTEELQNFLHEAQTIAKLIHPNIVRVLDYGEYKSVPFIVMDYAPEGNLRKLYPKGYRVPLGEIVLYVKQIASALDYAHERRIIHRDVKPENMLLGRTDTIWLSDFGIASVAHGQYSQSWQGVVGTMAYMAPEQFDGLPRPASDQYALAVIVYEWLCGKRPFEGTTMEIVNQHLRMPPPPLQERVPGLKIPPEVEGVLHKALAKKPSNRYGTVRAFSEELEEAIQSDLALEQTDRINSFTGTMSPLVLSPEGGDPSSREPGFHYEYTVEVEPALPTSFDSGLPGNLPTIPVSPPSGANQTFYSEPARQRPFVESPGQESFVESILGSVIPDLAPIEEKDSPVAPEISQDRLALSELPTIAIPSSPPINETSYSTVPLSEPQMLDSNVMRPSQPSPQASESQVSKEQLVASGIALYKAGQYKQSLDTFEQAIALAPEDAELHVHKGHALRKLRKNREALHAYERALELNPDDASAWHLKAEILFRLGIYDQASSACEFAVLGQEDNSVFWLTYARTLRKLGKHQNALIAYQKAQHIRQGDYLIFFARCEYLFELGQYQDILICCAEIAEFIDTCNKARVQAKFWMFKGQSHYKLNQYSEALEAYDNAYVLNPRDSTIMRERDMLHGLVSQHRRSQQLLEDLGKDDRKPDSSEEPQLSQSDNVYREDQIKVQQARSTQDDTKQYDVYLTCRLESIPWVKKHIAERLEDDEGLKAWMDDWYAVPGQSFIQEKTRGMSQSRCCAVCIGQNTTIGWFGQEIDLALNKQAENLAFGVIPVFLPEAKNIDQNGFIDSFLMLRTWIDLRSEDQEDYEEEFHRLVAGIKGKSPGRPQKRATSTSGSRPDVETTNRLRTLHEWRQNNLINEETYNSYQPKVLDLWLEPRTEGRPDNG